LGGEHTLGGVSASHKRRLAQAKKSPREAISVGAKIAIMMCLLRGPVQTPSPINHQQSTINYGKD
jgi:hypothetical protein